MAKYQYETYENFLWDEYLKSKGGVAAPKHCFKQSVTVLQNEFEIGMLLESADPRKPDSVCLASVVGKKGPRIQLRLDGSDKCNDFWRLVDDSSLRPCGATEKRGGILVPPLGFTQNPSQWPRFVKQRLAGGKHAPESCFKESPQSPTENKFKVGQKLEAVDLKNPDLICPATIGDIKENQVFIAFDGWRGAFDYWIRYDSRDLFPVYWCISNNHNLQHPGLNLSRRPSASPALPRKTGSPPLHEPLQLGVSESRDPAVALTPGSLTSPANLPSVTGASPRTATSQLSPNSADSSNTADHSDSHVSVHINANCQAGPYLSIPKVRHLPASLGPGTPQQVLRMVIQKLVDTAATPKQIFDKIPKGKSNSVITERGTCLQQRLPTVDSSHTMWQQLTIFLDQLHCCRNLVRPTVSQCPRCVHPDLKPARATADVTSRARRRSADCAVNAELPKKSRTNNFRVPAMYNWPEDPDYWTIDEVVAYLCEADLAIYAEPFIKQEIDGRAILMLTPDMMMKYMGLKLGPALKIGRVVQQLKARHDRLHRE